MDQNELELKKAELSAGAIKFNAVIKLCGQIVAAVTVIACVWIIFKELYDIVSTQSPEGISAFAKVINALKLGSIIGYLWGGGMSVAWWKERKGKKRAISLKGKYQKSHEASDTYRSSSELTEEGDTPDEEGS